jgi:hypothetical protein
MSSGSSIGAWIVRFIRVDGVRINPNSTTWDLSVGIAGDRVSSIPNHSMLSRRSGARALRKRAIDSSTNDVGAIGLGAMNVGIAAIAIFWAAVPNLATS